MHYDVIIVGGGASGLACAARLSSNCKRLKIKIIDACDRLGRKLSATGNGQGNISNIEMTVNHFHGGNTRLAEKIACKDAYAGTRLFDCIFFADEKGRIYPAGRQASALADELIRKINHTGAVDCACGQKVEEIAVRENGKFCVNYGVNYDTSDFAAVCVGGSAQKQYKTDGTSYALAKNLGHTITVLYPSLVQIKTELTDIKTLKGIRADCRLSALYNGTLIADCRGDVIFTEYGVSGNAVFSVSSYISDKRGITLTLEFLPDVSFNEIKEIIEKRKRGGCKESELLSGTLHNQLGRAVIKRAGSSDPAAITKTLKKFELPVKGVLGFDYAQVTKGGINMREITDELESKICRNLFFAGEVLDVDGDCGGYNLQWAFTSGIAVADAILKRV